MKTIKKALFEIIIVFIGVSFAFILNNWTEESSKSTKEQFYIAGYLKDLTANSEELSLIMEQDSIWLEKIRPHIHLLSSNSYKADSAMSLVLLIGTLNNCTIIENTNNLIINSGEFNLISDNIIQNNIIQMNTAIENVIHIEEFVKNYFNDHTLPFIKMNFDLLNRQFNSSEILKDVLLKNEVLIFTQLKAQRLASYQELYLKIDSLNSTMGEYLITIK